MQTQFESVVSKEPVVVENTEQLNPRRLFKITRSSLGMNQADFAKALGVSQGLVSLIESGRTPVSKKVTSKLSELSSKD